VRSAAWTRTAAALVRCVSPLLTLLGLFCVTSALVRPRGPPRFLLASLTSPFSPSIHPRFSNQAGYVPPNNAAPKDFAEFQKEMAAKKAAMKK